MSTAVAQTVRVCPECHADNDAYLAQCWVCHADLASAPEIVFADLVAESGAKTTFSQGRLVELIALGVGALVVAGTFTQSLGLGILLAIVWIVALVVILCTRPGLQSSLSDAPLVPRNAAGPTYYADSAALQGGRPQGMPLPRITPASTIIRQVLVVLGVVALIMFAAFIGLCIACFAMIAAMTSGPH